MFIYLSLYQKATTISYFFALLTITTNNAAFLEDVAQNADLYILPIKTSACKLRCIVSIRTYIALSVSCVVDWLSS